MAKTRRTRSLKSCFKRLVLVEAVLYMIIVICCTFLGQRMYRTQVEEETQNLLRVSFANLENTLYTLDSIALNLVNDRTIQTSLLSLRSAPDGVVLLDDFYSEIISASLLGNSQVTISVLDEQGIEYSSGSITLRLTLDELETVRTLLEQRSSFSSPVWFLRPQTGALVYARTVYSFPYKKDSSPIGFVVIQANIGKSADRTVHDSLRNGKLLMAYRGEIVYEMGQGDLSPEMREKLLKQDGLQDKRYVCLRQDSRFSDVVFYGLEEYQALGKPVQAIFWWLIISLLGICGVSLVLSLRLVHRISGPIEKLSACMERADFEVSGGEEESAVETSGLTELDMLELKFREMLQNLRDLVRSNYLRQIKEKEYQLRALQSQINPHFLYNTLDSIHWLALDCEQQEISTMVQSLASLFRETTRQTEYLIPLREELRLLSCYTAIQKIRLEERFQLTVETPEECLELMIPKLSLQPILENSMQYGAESSTELCRVLVRAVRHPKSMVVYVADNGPGISPEQLALLRRRTLKSSSTGIGLVNIQDRIRMLCPPGSDLVIRSRLGYGTLVKLVLRDNEEDACITL